MPSDVSIKDYATGVLRRFRLFDDGTMAEKQMQVDAAGNPVAGTNGGQKSSVDTLQTAATANANGAASTTDGYETLQVFISNGAGTCTVTIQGSLDSAFTTAQDALVLGVIKDSDSVGGVNTNRAVVSGVLAIAANTSYLYTIYDILPYVRAVISGAAGLAGVTVKIYKLAV